MVTARSAVVTASQAVADTRARSRKLAILAELQGGRHDVAVAPDASSPGAGATAARAQRRSAGRSPPWSN
jgi:hypothetical protein